MIIAIDFDGVLVEDKFPEIGPPDTLIINAVKSVIKAGHEVILWTCRVGKRLEDAILWCERHRLDFAAINSPSPTNLAEYGTNPRKVYADYYIDDRMLGYSRFETVVLLRKISRGELQR